MIKQIRNLTKLQLMNLYGMNVFRYTKDKKEKQKKCILTTVYLFLVIMAIFYVGAMTYGYIHIGLAELLPAYIIMIASMFILFLSVFKAGSIIFQRNAYDILSSLPLSQGAIVVSRFVRMYVESVILAIVVMVPAMVVYGVMIDPGISFYIIGIITMVSIPLIPITLSVFIGAFIMAIASRSKHKSLISSILSILLIVGFMLGTSQMSAMEDKMSVEMLQNILENALVAIAGIYPPAVWLGNAMQTGDFLVCFGCLAGGVLLFIVVMVIVSANYHWICQGLYSTNANHDYRIHKLRKTSVLGALYKRELKRYFSSSVYVTNTIMGPVMTVIFSVAVLSIGIDSVQEMLEIPIDIKGSLPFVLAAIFCVMPTTASAISLEGKEWWIVKSLPIRTKELLNSKILLNVSLILPFYIVSEILLIIALKPDIFELLWLTVIPAVMIVFSSVFGIVINLKMPVFNWENEVTVVKQSASSMIGGIGGLLIVIICMIPTFIIPAEYSNIGKAIICTTVIGATMVLYQKICKNQLPEI